MRSVIVAGRNFTIWLRPSRVVVVGRPPMPYGRLGWRNHWTRRTPRWTLVPSVDPDA